MARPSLYIYAKFGIALHALQCAIWSVFACYAVYVTVFGAPLRPGTAAEPPPAVSLTDFSRWDDVHAKEEISVIGRLESDDPIELTGDGKTRQMFVLFGPESAAEDKTVRGLILLGDEDAKTFVAMLPDFSETSAIPGAILINGQRQTLPPFNREAEANLAERGLTLSDQYIYIKPFLHGRFVPGKHPTWVKIVAVLFFTIPALIHLQVVRFRIGHNARVRRAIATGQVNSLIPEIERRDTILAMFAAVALLALIGLGAYFKVGF